VAVQVATQRSITLAWTPMTWPTNCGKVIRRPPWINANNCPAMRSLGNSLGNSRYF
jgi:hypothetical protein